MSRDDDTMMEDDFLPTPARKVPVTAVSSLSTYVPLAGTNFFPLSPGELDQTAVPTTAQEYHACVVLLSPSETLALLGTYKLRVLRGLVSLSGVTLQPSTTPHHVFAPRCAAIPVIEALHKEVDGEDEQFAFPERIQAAFDRRYVAVLLEELHTGVEGLGKVCRTFEDTFSIYKPRDRDPMSQLGLRGVHIVSCINIIWSC